MVFDPNINQGEILTNDDIHRIFQCSTQGGMRRSLRTNSLVIVSDHTKSIYEDRWSNEIFHYTGMGLEGDQSLSFAQNKTINESEKNYVDLFLFEVFGFVLSAFWALFEDLLFVLGADLLLDFGADLFVVFGA